MSETYTPGPWVVMEGQWADHSEDGGGGFHFFMGEYKPKDGVGIISARLLQYGDGFYPEDKGYDEVKANANLIAAAPDLLEALKAMDATLCDGFENQAARMAGRKALISARAAIAKAEGRS